jgi:predicted DNA-binding transcriptional regulator AlpA
VKRSELLQDQLAYAPRGLRADRAASYLGMGRTFFLDLVEQGVMPKPIKIRGLVVWDRAELDSAFDALKQQSPTSRRNTADEAMGIKTTDD